ncbi:MAG: transcription termination factor NusA [Planctomycetaceae bacterium]|nr:transcription termination factor NusA [Planctomycetaceae bacterium]
MNPSEVLRIVDAIHRDKRIDKEIVFSGVEAAILTAARKQYGEEADISVRLDRTSGEIFGTFNGEEISPSEMAERIGAQSAKQVMIQKIREAERDAIYDEYHAQLNQMISGVVQKNEGSATVVAIPNVAEAILPRAEKIPGENHRPSDRIRAVVVEVKKNGNRVKVILSRTRTSLIRHLFEQEIPEIADGVIEIKGISREPGYRTKIAVHSSDQRIDCRGACIGVRGSRIKNILDEIGSERIDVVLWNDDMQVMIPSALEPAEIEEVILCSMLGRAVVLVRPDQRSLAIGKKGQNVRLASRLCGWDVEIMTRDELDEQLSRVLTGFVEIEGVSSDLADRLVGEGFLSFDDLSVIEPSDLMEIGELTEEEAAKIIEQAEILAEKEEQEPKKNKNDYENVEE